MQIAQGEFIYVNENTMWAFSHKSYKVGKHTNISGDAVQRLLRK